MSRQDKPRIEPSFGNNAKDGWRVSKADRPRVDVNDDDDEPTAPKKSKQSSKPKKATAKAMKKDKALQRRSWIGRLFYWGIVMGLWGLIALTALFGYYALRLPPIQNLAVPKRPPNVEIVAMDGTLLANRGETGGSEVRLEELPPYVGKAFVAIEDHRFYNHFGLDPIGLTRALASNVMAGGVAQGGSTLTQQLAKNLFLTPDRTLGRKVQEAILALWLERNYDKEQILELYLNRVYFGAGAYGIEAASRRYFSKSARALTLTEGALLAGLVKAPSKLAPTRNPELAIERSKLVLAAMQEHGFIATDEAAAARSRLARPIQNQNGGAIGYLADWVMDSLDDHIGKLESNVRVVTTIDLDLQKKAEAALTEELGAKGEKLRVTQGAVVIMDPSGSVRAMVGGRNYAESQFNRAVAAKRQPGSAFKPFVYLAALERGLRPNTIRDDTPVTLRGWSPENYKREYLGPVSLTTALAQSINTVAVKLIMEMGPRNVARTAERMGIGSKLEPNASLALGTSEVTPLELTAAYAPFMNGGLAVIPHVIDKVINDQEKTLFTRSGSTLGRVINRDEAAFMTAMMEEVIRSGTGRKAAISRPAAGKTGTTQDFKDAWFVGYTAQLVGTVWVGNDDGTPMKKVTGGGLPAEIWSRTMRAAHANWPVLPLSSREIDPANEGDLDQIIQDQAPGGIGQDSAPSGRPLPPPPRSLDSEWIERLFGR